jgi:hypothetical protein
MLKGSLILSIGLALLLGLSPLSCLEKQRRPSRFLIPEGYVGWVRVDYGVNGAPALEVASRRYVVKIPPRGHVQTSTEIEYGWGKDQYYYYSDGGARPTTATGWGGGGTVWAGETGDDHGDNGERTGAHLAFFVGTEEEYRKCGADYGDHRIGPADCRDK